MAGVPERPVTVLVGHLKPVTVVEATGLGPETKQGPHSMAPGCHSLFKRVALLSLVHPCGSSLRRAARSPGTGVDPRCVP